MSGVPNRRLSIDLTERSQNYSAVLYNITNGLPTSEANAIAETSDSFIWIGSYAGLIRYDGKTFERMDSTTGVGSVTSLYVDSEDSTGTIYAATTCGIAMISPDGVLSIMQDDAVAGLNMRSIRAEYDGII